MGRFDPPYLPNMAILARMPPCEAISMPQDDSKQWEHLLSQENGPSWLDFSLVNLNSISMRSRAISATSSTSAELPKKATRAAEADDHENGRSWALIPSTGAGQHTWMLFRLQCTEMIFRKKSYAAGGPTLYIYVFYIDRKRPTMTPSSASSCSSPSHLSAIVFCPDFDFCAAES